MPGTPIGGTWNPENGTDRIVVAGPTPGIDRKRSNAERKISS